MHNAIGTRDADVQTVEVVLRCWMDLFAEWLATKRGMRCTLLLMIDSGTIERAHTRAELLSAITTMLESTRDATGRRSLQ